MAESSPRPLETLEARDAPTPRLGSRVLRQLPRCMTLPRLDGFQGEFSTLPP